MSDGSVPMLSLADSHCHLQSDRFEDDRPAVLARAREAGLERICVPGWNRRSSEEALELVARETWLDASVGVHPHDAARVDDAEWAWFEDAARDPSVVAIGETGLDFDRLFSPVDAQIANLRRNLDLALRVGKPVILHCRSRAGARDAQDVLVAELRRSRIDDPEVRSIFGGGPPAVIHSFSGPADYASTVIALGCAVAFGGLVFRAGEEASAEAVRIVPPDRLLLETDAPFLAPPGAASRRNEPAFVGLIAAWAATQRGETPDAVGAASVASYERLFGPQRR